MKTTSQQSIAPDPEGVELDYRAKLSGCGLRMSQLWSRVHVREVYEYTVEVENHNIQLKRQGKHRAKEDTVIRSIISSNRRNSFSP